MDQICSRRPSFTLSSLTCHRFVIASIAISSKAFCDAFCTNAHYAKVGGISVSELNLLEREFLSMIDWRLVVRVPSHVISLANPLFSRLCPPLAPFSRPLSAPMRSPLPTAAPPHSQKRSHGPRRPRPKLTKRPLTCPRARSAHASSSRHTTRASSGPARATRSRAGTRRRPRTGTRPTATLTWAASARARRPRTRLRARSSSRPRRMRPAGAVRRSSRTWPSRRCRSRGAEARRPGERAGRCVARPQTRCCASRGSFRGARGRRPCWACLSEPIFPGPTIVRGAPSASPR